ncbi:MAG: ROK family protein, partial [Planctomycetota bacterium]
MAQRPRVSVGCDVGGTNVKLVRLRDAALEARLVIPTGGSGRPSGFVSALADAISSLLPRGRSGSPAGDRAVGVALPGFLDAKRGRVVYLSNVPALAGVPLRRRLAARLGCPVALDADTNAGAVGE